MFVDDTNVRSLSIVNDDVDPLAVWDGLRETAVFVLLVRNGRRPEARAPSLLFLFDRDDIPSVGSRPEVSDGGQFSLM